MKRALSVVFCALALNGCASFYQPTASAWVKCSGAQCDKLWARAQTWLAANSAYKIQFANENIIQTFGPHEGVYDAVAYTVTKEIGDEGSGKILIRGACAGTIYGCSWDPSIATNRLHSELIK